MQLIDINELAVMLGCSVSHARQNVVTHRAFPTPVLLPGGTKRPMKRWHYEEVAEFLGKLKAPPPKSFAPGRPLRDESTARRT